MRFFQSISFIFCCVFSSNLLGGPKKPPVPWSHLNDFGFRPRLAEIANNTVAGTPNPVLPAGTGTTQNSSQTGTNLERVDSEGNSGLPAVAQGGNQVILRQQSLGALQQQQGTLPSRRLRAVEGGGAPTTEQWGEQRRAAFDASRALRETHQQQPAEGQEQSQQQGSEPSQSLSGDIIRQIQRSLVEMNIVNPRNYTLQPQYREVAAGGDLRLVQSEPIVVNNVVMRVLFLTNETGYPFLGVRLPATEATPDSFLRMLRSESADVAIWIPTNEGGWQKTFFYSKPQPKTPLSE